MKENATLEDIWKRVKEETKNPKIRVNVYGSMAESRGYTLKQINDYLSTVSPNSEEYHGRTVGASDKTGIRDNLDYDLSANITDLANFLLGQIKDTKKT